MRRVCMDCKAFLGWKCGHCGSLRTRELPASARKPARRACMELSCQRRIDPNSCPETQGLCDGCLAKRRAA